MKETITAFQIEKANGALEPYQEEKIITAVKKAAMHTNEALSYEDQKQFEIKLREYIQEHVPNQDVILSVDDVHAIVMRLIRYVRSDISSKYNEYKTHKNKQSKQAIALTEQLSKETSFIDIGNDSAERKIRDRIKTIIHKLKTKHHIEQPAAFVVLNVLFEDIHYQKPEDTSNLLSVLKEDIGLQTLTNWIMIELEKAKKE